MPLSINTNVASLTAQRAMINSNAGLESAFERLSTGKRINSAADDAAGLAIGKDLESRVSGLNQAIRNVNDGISMVQIAEGALDEVTTILQRMRDLSVQAANGSLSSVDQGYLDTEQSKLAESLGTALDQVKFNNTDLVSDTAATSLTLQSGSDSADTTTISFAAMTEELLGVSATAINLSGTTSTAEVVTLAGFRAKDMVSAELTLDVSGTNAGLATGGTGTYTAVIDGNTFTTATIAAPGSASALATALNAVSGVSSLGTFSDASGDLKFTAAAGGALAATGITLVSSGFTTNLDSDGSGGTVDFDLAGGTAGVDGTTVVGDKYTLTVGSDTFETVAATATTDYKTNAQIAAGLNTAVALVASNNNTTAAFTVGTAGGYDNGAITITYATNGDKTETTYLLSKTAGAAADTDIDSTTTATISDGTSKASDAITSIDAALATVAGERATLGATQSQLESTVRNLANVAENTAAATGRIMDTDYAAETANLTKAQILQQAATSILAQANAQPQSVLALLR